MRERATTLAAVLALSALVDIQHVDPAPVASIPMGVDTTLGWSLEPIDTAFSPESKVLREPRWSPDGRFLAMEGVGGLYLVEEPFTGPAKHVLGGFIHDVAWSLDGRYLAVSGREPEIRIYDTAGDSLRASIQNSAIRFFGCLMWTQDARLAAAWPDEGTPFLCDLDGESLGLDQLGESGYVWQRIGHGSGQAEIHCRPSGHVCNRRLFGPDMYFMLVSQSPVSGLFAYTTDRIVPRAVTTAVADHEGRTVRGFEFGFSASDWTADGRWLIGTVSRDDGHRMLSAEISIYDAIKDRYAVITETPDVIEQNPSFCPVRNLMAWDDDKGHVIIARVVR